MENDSYDFAAIGERVQQARKHEGLSQAIFASDLGLSRDSVNNLEHARIKSLPMVAINMICSKYGVDKDWLLYGKGDMIHEPPEELIEIISEVLKGENEIAKSVFKAFAKFSEDDWKTVEKFIDSIKNE